MGETREQKIIRQLSGVQTNQKFTPIATGMFLPNHSGDHSAGIVNTTPTANTDIANKAYVDTTVADYIKYKASGSGYLTVAPVVANKEAGFNPYIWANGSQLWFGKEPYYESGYIYAEYGLTIETGGGLAIADDTSMYFQAPSYTFNGLTASSVIFTGTGGVLSVDNSFIWDNTNKRLGIGVTPLYPLHVQTSMALTGATGKMIFATSTGAYIDFYNTGGASLGYIGDNQTAFSFYTRNTINMTFNASNSNFIFTGGYMGLGVTPTDTLDVSGYVATEGASGGFKLWNRASKTGNPWIFYNSSDILYLYSGANLFQFSQQGGLYIGANVSSYITGLYVYKTSTITSSYMLNTVLTTIIQPTGNSSAEYYTCDYQIQPDTSYNITGICYGQRMIARSNSTGTCAEMRGQHIYCDKYNTGAVTNLTGLKITMGNRHATGAVTNSFAIWLAPSVVTGTITNNYGIFQEGTETNYFGGKIGIGAVATVSKLYVSDTVSTSKGANYPMSDLALTVSQTEGTYATIGQQISLYKTGANNYTTSTGLRGMQMQCLNQGSGNVTSLVGNFIYVANTAASTVTDRTGIYLYASGGAGYNVTTAYGIYIDTQKNTGVTTAYGVYQKDANDLNYFAGTVQAGGYLSSDGSAGLTVTITTAKLTAGGANGSMTFKNGILTAQTAAT